MAIDKRHHGYYGGVRLRRQRGGEDALPLPRDRLLAPATRAPKNPDREKDRPKIKPKAPRPRRRGRMFADLLK